jgi:STE24 endopeptidase
MLVALTTALALGLTPAGSRLVELCGRPFGGGWPAQALVGGSAVLLVGGLITLPFAAWCHVLAVRHRLSTQGWGGWAADQLKGFAVSGVLGAGALLVFYSLTRAAPDWWWAFAAVAAAALVIMMSFVFPVLVEPVFNRFTALPEGPLRADLMAMAARDAVPVRDVLVADASRRTRAVNAYVSGFGATRRIVVYDTLLERAGPAEIRSVVAHELGHARGGDVITGTVLGALGSAAGVIALFLLGSWSALLRRAGVDSIAEPRAVALLLAVASTMGVILGPLQSLVSRRIESRADDHALALTGDAATFEAMQARLSGLNLSDPDPHRLEYLLFASHPSTVERMAAARTFARGTRGEPPAIG